MKRFDFRTKETLKFISNLIFAVFNCVLGIVMKSWWFTAAGAYYIILSVMRICVMLFSQKQRENEKFIMKFSGGMLFALSVVLCGIVYMTVKLDVASQYHEIVMITIALYAFSKLTFAIRGAVVSRKNRRPYVRTLRSISFADAVVSIYSLQRSMLVSFPGMSREGITLFNTLTGVGVCVIVLLTGVNLILKEDYKIMAKSKISKANDKIAQGVTEGYKKIEDAVVGGYKKIEKGVVDGYTKIEDKFVEQYLAHDGETVEEAKERLKNQKENKD